MLYEAEHDNPTEIIEAFFETKIKNKPKLMWKDERWVNPIWKYEYVQ